MESITNKRIKCKNKFVNSHKIRYSLINEVYVTKYQKGPWVDPKLLKKILQLKPSDKTVIKTWSRDSVISPEMIGFTIGVHNGKIHIAVKIIEEMVGHRLGEFSPTRKFIRHGGKIQKELEQKAAEAQKTQEATAVKKTT